ncbi:endoplasmic reticulum mannosyl-oligosaccharide 1 [Trichoderma cornu-damae]|uniref:alpha-1,2-Mannosidase n=1 Tax=Trichoderma cornu-damae TaxID=654480 RepID=A0A9P8TTU1_9HYPO|nr:endoplasmic reticulum mannosyl-oligosaccharide 1 [Trichoderma cornu-damae]
MTIRISPKGLYIQQTGGNAVASWPTIQLIAADGDVVETTEQPPSSSRGESPRRHVALLTVFAFVAFFLWNGFGAIPRSGTVGRFNYVPGSRDWGKAKVYHPVKDIKEPPKGTPAAFPRIQLRRRSERRDDTANARKQAVKNAFVKSWESYKTHAWTRDELMPLSGKGRESFGGWSAQLVDALDTLWIMGLKDDFFLAVKEVAVIDWAKPRDDKAVRPVRGDDPIPRRAACRAVELGDAIYAAMSAAAGGTLGMEFTRLSQITGDPKYYDATERIKRFFRRFQNDTSLPGMWPAMQNYREEQMVESRYTIGAQADSMYEYLVKMHPLLGGGARSRRTKTSSWAGNALAAGRGNVEHVAEMHHLTCSAGGMYALAGKLFARGDYVDVGSRLAAGCVWAYGSFPSGIMPEAADLVACKKLDGPCPYDEALAPLSHDPRIPWATRETPPWPKNLPKTFWLAETLKYFYLIFDDEGVIDLDEWVF